MKRVKKEIGEIKDPILATLMMPAATKPIRFSDEFTATESGLTPLKYRLPTKWGQQGGTFPIPTRNQMPFTDIFFALFRDPLRAAVVYTQNPGIAGAPNIYAKSAYDWQQTQGDDTFRVNRAGLTALKPSHAIPSTLRPLENEWQPHGPLFFAALGNGNRYMFMDQTVISPTIMTFLLDNPPAADNQYQLNIFVWNFGIDEFTIVRPFTAGAGITQRITLATAGGVSLPTGYYRFEIQQNADVGGGPAVVTSCQITQTTQVDQFAHLTLPFLAQNAATLQGVRINALSYMLENVAADLFRQGKCATTQVGKNESWLSYALSTQTALVKILNVTDQADFQLNHGMYAYLKPGGDRDFEMESPFVLRLDTNWSAGGYPVEDDSDYLVGVASVTQAGTIVAGVPPNNPAADMYLHFDFHVEFNTSNQWFYTDIPKTMPVSWSAALTALRFKRQFFNNASHYKDIMGDIGVAINTFAPLAPLLAMGMMGGM